MKLPPAAKTILEVMAPFHPLTYDQILEHVSLSPRTVRNTMCEHLEPLGLVARVGGSYKYPTFVRITP